MGQTNSELTLSSPRFRLGHNAAIVDQQMLVWGGRDGNCHYFTNKSIWMFNVSNNSWSERILTSKRPEDLPRPSSYSRIAVVESRQIYQFGGMYSQSPTSPSQWFNDLHKLDGLAFRWKRVFAAGPIPEERSDFGFCALGDHLVLMGGGKRGRCKGDLWLFSLKE
eukprot:m.213940 g.213940  ORF g.213940 m.213940 type:complete len:165 (+) comp39802_c1_seq14:259-753(+)